LPSFRQRRKKLSGVVRELKKGIVEEPHDLIIVNPVALGRVERDRLAPERLNEGAVGSVR